MSHQAGVADDPAFVERDERAAGQGRLVIQPVVERDDDVAVDCEIGVPLVLGERVRLAKQLRPVGDRHDLDAFRHRRLGQLGGERDHLLDLPVDLLEAESLRERARARIVDGRPRLVEAQADHVLRQPMEHRGADPAPASIRMHARVDEPSAPHVGGPSEPSADDLAVELRDEHEPVGLVTLPKLLHAPRRLVRERRALDANPPLQVRIRLGCADLDAHPDLFSFPWRFAYRSPRRKTSSPSGTETIPITTSGQSSSPMAVMPAPSMIASRIPSSA